MSIATFLPYAELVGASLTGSYQTLIDPLSPWLIAMFFNDCDEDVFISFDNGTTDHMKVRAGRDFTIPLSTGGLSSRDVIKVKHAGAVPTSGSVIVSLIK